MNKPIVTVISKNGCAPCEAVKQLLKTNNIEFTEINAFDNPDIAQKLRIRKVPTIMLTKEPLNIDNNDEIIPMITGDNIISKVQDFIKSYNN